MDEQAGATHEGESNYQSRLAKIHAVELIDQKFGFQKFSDPEWRTAWLFNVQQAEMFDEDSKSVIAVCDFYFLQDSGDRFKVSCPFRPYLYLATLPNFELQVSSFLSRKYGGIITVDIVTKEDLDLKNHLSGLKRQYMKVSFPSLNELQKFKRELIPVLKRNQQREKTTSSYTALLSRHLGAEENVSDDGSMMEKIIDMREHDLPYQMRVCIDLGIYVGLWYRVIGRDSNRLPKIVRHPNLIDPPESIVLAFDIEVTKLPLKFPSSATDEIMMISYMINGSGYLIINRQIVADDIEDFEYTPKPEYVGHFKVINVKDEAAVIKYFFDHILRVKPLIFVTYNGDSFDWPFVETRAQIHGFNMATEIGFAKTSADEYKSIIATHQDAYKWVKRDSYLPVGSQNLKACTKAKLRYDPVELDPEQMCIMAKDQPQVLASYSVSDAVATYYLYMKYVHPFIFALCTIIPLNPDDVLRKGSGTLCEALLMVSAFQNNIIFPNKSLQYGTKYTADGHVVESETYVGGHVEAIESGIFRADIPERFRIVKSAIIDLKDSLKETLIFSLTHELGINMDDVVDFNEKAAEIADRLDDFLSRPNRMETPKIYHLDVGAMYPNIILTNRLQPPAIVTEEDCIACDFNTPDAKCQRKMRWEWRGETLPASRGEYERILQQLENERFGKPPKPYHSLDHDARMQIEKKRVQDFCKRAYGKHHITRTEFRHSTVCERENGFYVETVKAFRDRRYEYKALLKKAKSALDSIPDDDVSGLKVARGRVILYDSLQLAHKCILNSFYGYVMRKGSRWFSMEMAGIVCHTGANIITEARKLIEQIGRPLELDTDGIWCLIPSTFPENVSFKLKNKNRNSVIVSYPGAILNSLVRHKFTNDQYHELNDDGTYSMRSENSIFFEVDGPYLAMILPASREEGKKLKKRYAVFNFDGSLAEIKGFEIKRRGELALIKYFQSSVFKAFLDGSSREDAYRSAAKEADHWLDILFSKGGNCSDTELFDLISENRSMSKKLDDYGEQKSTSISTAKRLAEFLGDDMVKDAGLACRFIISKKPMDDPVAQRAIPLAIFQVSQNVTAHYLRKWTKDMSIDKDRIDIRNVVDWEYYIDRFGSAVQKIISIPAALQNLPNPVPRVPFPDWLENLRRQRFDDHKQPKIDEIFKRAPRRIIELESSSITEITISDSAEDAVPIKEMEKKNTLTRKLRPRKGNAPTKDSETVIEKSMQKKTIVEDGVTEWIRYMRWKWRKLYADKKQQKHEAVEMAVTPIQSMLARGKKSFREALWHIVKISESQNRGTLILWALINGKMMKISVYVPRIVYINDRKDESSKGVIVKRLLPRMKPAYHLRKYEIDEKTFEVSLNELNRELCAMRIEGIYESQISPLWRSVIEFGSSCRLKPDAKTFSVTSVQYDHLQADFSAEYLPDGCLRNFFFYEHRQDTRCLMALFDIFSKQAVIVIVNKVAVNVPNISNLFANQKFRSSDSLFNAFPQSREDITFNVNQCKTIAQADGIIQKFMRGLRLNQGSAAMIAVLSQQSSTSLTRRIPAFDDYPMVRIRAAEPSSLLSVLDWQRVAIIRLLKHYFNSFLYIHQYTEISRYLHVPLGNIPEDFATFAPDILFARNLLFNGHVLWMSPTTRPDLGGKELDDARLTADWSELRVTLDPASIINHPVLETRVCAMIKLGAVEMTAIVQSAKIAEAEGSSESVGFISDARLALDTLLGHSRSLANYDESAAVAAPLRVLRNLLFDIVKDIHLYSNKIADQTVSNLNRWLRTKNALLYDPAIIRVVDMLVTKLILLLVTEIERLGGQVMYASSSRIILCTKRTSIEQAQAFVNSLKQSLQQSAIFSPLNVTLIDFFNILLWVDVNNYIGVKFNDDGESNNFTVQIDTCKASETSFYNDALKQILIGYLALVAGNMRAEASEFEQQKFRSETINAKITHQMFDVINGLMRNRLINNFQKGGVHHKSALLLVKAVVHFIGLDKSVSEATDKMNYQLMRMLGIDDASDEAIWSPVNASCTLKQLFCASCGECNDLDVCHSDNWDCPMCNRKFSRITIECLLIERVNQMLSAFTIQDFRCKRCRSIRKHNLSILCECCGEQQTTIPKSELDFSLSAIASIAKDHGLPRLEEACKWAQV